MPSELYIPGETTVPYQCTPGPDEEIIATALRKTFAGLSVFGSLFIVWTIYLKWRNNKASIDPYCRIMLGLSLYDVLWSFFPWFMGSWLMPVGTGHWGASGNTHTCTMQGFFFWLGVPGAQYYQILLSLHTLLLVTFRWKPRDFERRIERHSHKVVFVVALVLATIPIFFEGYNPECSTCLPAPLPIWCGDWIFWGDGETECLRGNPTLSTSYYTIYLTNLSIMGVFCTGSMIQVYLSVRWQEDRNAQYASSLEFGGRSNPQRERSRRIRRTMILYTFGFYLCWVVPSFIIHFAQQGSRMIIMSYVLLPGQGFFNLIIFLTPKCAKYQKMNPGTSLVMAYVHVIFGKVCTPCQVCCVRFGETETFEAIRRRSSHAIKNPIWGSPSAFFSSRSNRREQTQVTQLEEWADEDSIGFQDFNEDLIENSAEGNPAVGSAQNEEEGGGLRDIDFEEDELATRKDNPSHSPQQTGKLDKEESPGNRRKDDKAEEHCSPQREPRSSSEAALRSHEYDQVQQLEASDAEVLTTTTNEFTEVSSS